MIKFYYRKDVQDSFNCVHYIVCNDHSRRQVIRHPFPAAWRGGRVPVVLRLDRDQQGVLRDPVTLEPAKEEGNGKEEEGRQVKPSHRLLIKTAILMPSAKKDEVTVVEIESEGYNKQKVGYLH